MRSASIEDPIEAVEERDWGDLANRATGLLTFLAARQRPLDDATRKGLSNAAHRAELHDVRIHLTYKPSDVLA